ncbi:MAG: hypothetical protein AAF192_18105 [Pseudomonadota bacterium]
MTDVLDRARAHFDAMRGRRLEVPEWGDDAGPLVVYADPLTLADRQALAKSGKGDDFKTSILAVIRHAKTAGGDRLFAEEFDARKVLETEADPAVILKIAQFIGGTGEVDPGE